MEKITEYANPLSRVLIALIFIMFGLKKYSITVRPVHGWRQWEHRAFYCRLLFY